MTAPAPARPRVLGRGWPEVVLVVGGTALLLLTALPIDADRLPAAEAEVFRALNGTTVLPFVLVWPVMQLGNVLVVPASTALAAAFRRWRLAAELLIAGATTYLLAKVVKGIWPRGRPDDFLTDVVIRGDAALGRGFVSGHAATLTALAAVAWPWLGRRGRIVVAALVTVVCLTRVYVGAHLPLDVIGGAGLGLAIAGLVRLVLGATGLMLVDSRRGLLVSGGLLLGAVLVTLLYVLPATRPAVQAVDDAVWEFAVAVENRPTTVLAVGLSWLGSAFVNWPLRVAALFLLAWRRHWLRLAAFSLAVLTSEVLLGTLKAAIDRPRPPDPLILTTAASFPSGHAIATAVTAVGLVLVLAPPGKRRWHWEVNAVILTSVMALSRVYLRAHWLSDTVAGALLGAGLALGWPALLMAIRHRYIPSSPTS